MIDRELALKLAKRFDKLSFDMDDPALFAGQRLQQQTVKQSPPPPSQKQQEQPPIRAISDNEWTDMDKLIGQTLQSPKVNSREEPYNVLSSKDHEPEPLKKPSALKHTVETLLQAETTKEQSEIEEGNQLVCLLPKCTAPVVPIIHHKSKYQKQSEKAFVPDDSSLQKEISELETKLAKQRQKKPAMSTEAESATPSALIAAVPEPEQSPFVPLTTPLPVSILPGSILNLTRSQWKNSRELPTVPKQSSVNMNQAAVKVPSSPTCSQLSASKDDDELAAKLVRRNMTAEGEALERLKPPKISIYSEFQEFTRKQIKYFMETFKKYDEDHDNYIDFNELKRMMEKLGEAQTHIALKNMLKLVDEDQDGKISPREFMLIFRYALTGQLSCAQVFNALAASVDVVKEGVHAAADFFEAKIEEQTKLSRFEEEIRAEQEERKLQEAEKKERRQQFLANKAVFI